jgi:hypothetical protein
LPRYPSGSRIPLELDEPPGETRPLVACVSARKRVDLALRAATGQIRFGPRSEAGCTQIVMAGQVAWYRLEPGQHALCIEEIPNRRKSLSYSFHGTWVARGSGVSLEVRERKAAP